MERADVAVVGGGILGTSVAFWLAARYDGRVVVLEREANVAEHASRRNTGVVHQPFYLDPKNQRLFARAARTSYFLWLKYAKERGLPAKEVGTYEVALTDTDMNALGRYLGYAAENGMAPNEVELLDGREMHEREPNVACAGAFFSKTDTAVDYHAFTQALRKDAEALSVTFLTGSTVSGIALKEDDVEISFGNGKPPLRARYLIGCAGGDAMDIAHEMGVALEYTDLHFRGEYWVIDPKVANLVSRNVYSVPRHRDLPFLDPHWIVRWNGQREIGPNAVPVAGSHSYNGGPMAQILPWIAKFYEPPIENKLQLLINPDFLTLTAKEMWSSVSKGEMMRRVQRFIPALRKEHLVSRGIAGIRTPAINRKGAIVKEAIEVPGPHSYHILNYNSPGATGAPAFAADLVDRLAARGDLDHMKRNPKPQKVWDWDAVAKGMWLG
jgi:L-2-hydroxyglutarate oxidase